MSTNKFNIRAIPAIIIGLLLLFVFLLPLEIEYSVSSYAKVLPAQQWVVMRGNDGMYISTIKDVTKGINSLYQVNQFERGGSVEVRLNPELRPNQVVNYGDTLGIIYSSTNMQRYIELQGRLSVAKAELDVNLSGEKESIIKQAEQNLKLAQSQEDRQSKVVDRLQQLYEKRIVSEEEYQLAADALRSLKIEVEVRQAAYETARTGAKDAEIQRLKMNIVSLENQIESIQNQLNSYNIIAPFTGRIERSFSNDTLLILSETEQCLVFIPIGIDEKKYLLPDSRISVSVGSDVLTASILDINNTIEVVNNKQCVTLTAVMDGTIETNYGMIVPVEIYGRMLTPYQYLVSLFNSESW
jgi:hypothetical protein